MFGSANSVYYAAPPARGSWTHTDASILLSSHSVQFPGYHDVLSRSFQ